VRTTIKIDAALLAKPIMLAGPLGAWPCSVARSPH